MRKYELFKMGDKETIMEMYTHFTHVTNELKSLGRSFTTEELVRKNSKIFATILGGQSHGYSRG